MATQNGSIDQLYIADSEYTLSQHLQVIQNAQNILNDFFTLAHSVVEEKALEGAAADRFFTFIQAIKNNLGQKLQDIMTTQNANAAAYIKNIEAADGDLYSGTGKGYERDFTAERMEYIRENLTDSNAAGWLWGFFNGDSKEDKASALWIAENQIFEEKRNSDEYLKHICEAQDISAKKLDEIWNDVKQIETSTKNIFSAETQAATEYCASVKDWASTLQALTTQLNAKIIEFQAPVLEMLHAEGLVVETEFPPAPGPDATQAEKDAYGRSISEIWLAALNKEVDLPLTAEQRAAALAFRQRVADTRDPFLNLEDIDGKPVPYEPSSLYGIRRPAPESDLEFHPGVDIGRGETSGIKGQEIISTFEGEVVYAGYAATGNTVILKTQVVDEFPPYELVDRYIHYYHMDRLPPVKTGDSVAPGSTLGVVGDTGKGSNGTHLHFQVSTDFNYLPAIHGDTPPYPYSIDNRNPSPYLADQYSHETITTEDYLAYDAHYKDTGKIAGGFKPYNPEDELDVLQDPSLLDPKLVPERDEEKQA